jgi:hypothetical protein
MKSKATFVFVSFAALALAGPLPAKDQKAELKKKGDAALVAALQAVSPDPLGGRLGLDLAAARAPKADFAAQPRVTPKPTAAVSAPAVQGAVAVAEKVTTKS